MSFYKAVQIGSFILGWLERAKRDGTIDQNEIIELVQGIINAAGLKIRIDLSKKD